MEQLQAELAEMRRQNENQMAQFMQAIAGLTQGQAELRNLVQNPGRNQDVEYHQLYDDVSGGISINIQQNEGE